MVIDMKVSMEITTDKYELPVAIADTVTGLAVLRGVDKASVWHCLHRPTKGKRRVKYVAVEIEEDDDDS